jgi:hypothetical protein
MASILSTAVQAYCAASATTLPASLTTPLPEVTAAMDVFNSYCARSTELIWCMLLLFSYVTNLTSNPCVDQNNNTASATPVITAPPSSTSAFIIAETSSNQISQSSKSVPVAAIAVPVVIGVLVIAGIVGLLFFLRRRKAAKKAGLYAPPECMPRGELGQGEVHKVYEVQEVTNPAQEVVGDSVKYRYELETRPAELEGERHGMGKR